MKNLQNGREKNRFKNPLVSNFGAIILQLGQNNKLLFVQFVVDLSSG